MMSHDYNFDCNCEWCSDITKYFHFKSKSEARRLGYDTTKIMDQTFTQMTKEQLAKIERDEE